MLTILEINNFFDISTECDPLSRAAQSHKSRIESSNNKELSERLKVGRIDRIVQNP